MNYYEDIKNKLVDNEIYEKVKDYSKERNRVLTYYEVGKLLYEAGKSYGDNIIGKYSEKLVNEVGKKYTRSVLFRMRQFYLRFGDIKIAPLVRQLTWSHCLILLPIKDDNKIIYYINQVISRNLSKRELQNIIKNGEYERLESSTKKKLIKGYDLKVTDLVKNPIIIKCSSNYNKISEKILKKIILENIDSFLKELGTGFSYIENEYKIKLGDRFNYIDLLLYNIEFNCYVVIELKTTELKKEHIGQVHTYMNFIDQNVKTLKQDKTIGIIICKKENEFVMEYCSDERIYTAVYLIKEVK